MPKSEAVAGHVVGHWGYTAMPNGPEVPTGLTVHMTRDATALITSVDEAIFDLLGWRPEQLVGSRSTGLMHPEDQPSAIASWVEMITSPGSVYVGRSRYRTTHGSWMWVETVNQLDDSDNSIVVTSMTRATAEQVSAEDASRARQQLLSRLSDALPVGVFQVDLAGNVTFTNDRLHAILGVPLAATVEAQMSSIVADDRPLLEAALAAVFADQIVDDIEVRLHHPDAEPSLAASAERVCLLSLRALTDSVGIVSGAVGCLSDVTNRIRLENELRQGQRLEAIGLLAGGVAHDFNNLLMVILNYGEFIAEDLPEDHPLQADLGEVRKAAERAAELTHQLLVFSRRDLVHPSILDVNAAISDVVSLLKRTVGEEVQLKALLSPDLPGALSDAGELQQVLMNLVVNARQAIEGDGTITIQTSEQLIDEEAASTHIALHPGRYVRIAITDSGCGMAPETVEHVFEPFFTTKDPESGTGLGLSTVYGIVSRCGGCVTVSSEVGVGTTFKVYLRATEPAEAPGAASGTVLLVEDEDAVRSASRRILERAGFRVLEASDAAQALVQIDGHEIDLLLTDIVMPGGMSGLELAHQFQQMRPGLPVLFMSGYSADAIATRGVVEPGINIIAKPCTSADLLRKIRELLSQPPSVVSAGKQVSHE
jgi:two-component system cell cycle sensor histidine kinase/response regulator CckA